jgi:hypothetical protein
MKLSLVLLATVAVFVSAGCGSSHRSSAPASSTAAKTSSPFLPQPPFAGPREIVLYGHVKSLTRKGARFELRFDPAELLSGETANRAAIEDKVIPPGDVVPNDHYIRDVDHRLLTFVVPAGAHATVVTNPGLKGITATVIPVSELAEIVKGKNPKHRALFEPKNPFWIVVATDTVRSLDQQYSP